jgi:hypothetical protein
MTVFIIILFYNILGVYTSSIKEIGGRNCESLFLTKNYKTLLSKIKEYHIRYGAESMENVP